MKWFGNTPVSPSWGCRDQDGLGRLDEDELAARGCGDQGGDLEGPAVSASSPLCGSGVFFPHGTQGRFVQFSQFDSPRGGWGDGGWGGAGGGGRGKKENPTSLVVLKKKGLPPLLSLFLPPDFFFNYNLEGFCFSSRLLGRRRRRRFTPVPQSPPS